MISEFPYGNWPSIITTEMITQESIGFGEMQSDGDQLYWTELRPTEKGRVALVKRNISGELTELLPEMSIRTRVHEYGGGAFCVRGGTVYFSNDKDRAYYRFENGSLEKICEDSAFRFADGSIAQDGNSLYLVCEEHRDAQVRNYLMHMDRKGKRQIIASGHDFYSSPRLSPDGKRLAFLTWDFPNMPWDGSELWLLDISGSSKPIKIAGGAEESICQVQWSPGGVLYFCSDRTGYWNLYRYKEGVVESLYEKRAEFGLPAWVFARNTYAFLNTARETIVCVYSDKGIDRLGLLYPNEHQLKELDLPFTYVAHLCAIREKAYFVGASPMLSSSVIEFDVHVSSTKVLKQGVQAKLDSSWISLPQAIEYPSLEGKIGYGFFYPPRNPNVAIQEDPPPLIVRCHGGPTSRSYAIFSLEALFWTSRGFALLDVNYGGSTGYGREYIRRLESKWGVLDVADVLSAAHEMVERGKVDPHHLFVRGGSAGGYTVLCTLAHDHTFSGGTSYYGVSDLELLCKNTHKFESQYVHRLVAPYPEGIAIIRSRSPIHQIQRINTPTLLLQGEEDAVVPPDQSEAIYEALKSRDVPVHYVLFKGEGHGFRSASTIRQAFEEELRFYQELLKSSTRPLQ